MTRQQTITVLIIDDDEDDRFFIERAFRTDSLYTQVHTAANGHQALNLLSAVQPLPDVILLDLNMPGMTGFEVLEQLKQSTQHQSIPVVILTTSNDSMDQERGNQLGASEFITKPTTSDGLSTIPRRLRLGLLE